MLEPLAPTIRDETDSWPEFSLKHTRVLSQSTGKIVSLLEANRDHLVRVEGDLDEVDEDQRKLCRYLNPNRLVACAKILHSTYTKSPEQKHHTRGCRYLFFLSVRRRNFWVLGWRESRLVRSQAAVEIISKCV